MATYADFEQLLEKHASNMENMKYNEYNEMKNGVKDSQLLKADKNASLFDFIKMVDKLVTLTMKDLNVKFIPDEGKSIYLSNDQRLDEPIITYKVISRKPKGEIKPRYREGFNNTDSGSGEIYGQKFKCHIQFNIFASVYELVEQVMERFEELMITYAGYFKRNGVGEILFDQQYTDSSFETMRQSLSIRNLSYYVEVEKLTVIMRENIQAIETY